MYAEKRTIKELKLLNCQKFFRAFLQEYSDILAFIYLFHLFKLLLLHIVIITIVIITYFHSKYVIITSRMRIANWN